MRTILDRKWLHSKPQFPLSDQKNLCQNFIKNKVFETLTREIALHRKCSWNSLCIAWEPASQDTGFQPGLNYTKTRWYAKTSFHTARRYPRPPEEPPPRGRGRETLRPPASSSRGPLRSGDAPARGRGRRRRWRRRRRRQRSAAAQPRAGSAARREPRRRAPAPNRRRRGPASAPRPWAAGSPGAQPHLTQAPGRCPRQPSKDGLRTPAAAERGVKPVRPFHSG